MIPLAFGVAILDEHTRLTCLETDASPLLLATISTADDVDLVHPSDSTPSYLILQNNHTATYLCRYT
jgi:hypothetical protein